VLTSGGVSKPLPVDPGSLEPDSKLRKAAQDFAAILLGEMLTSLQKTFAGVPGGEVNPAADNYAYMGVQALAHELAGSGGLGLTDMISKQMAALSRAENAGGTKGTIAEVTKVSEEQADFGRRGLGRQ